LPAWLAVNTQVPPPTMVSWLPLTVQIVPTLLVLKAVRPLDAVAGSVLGPAPKVTGVGGAKVIVCEA